MSATLVWPIQGKTKTAAATSTDRSLSPFSLSLPPSLTGPCATSCGPAPWRQPSGRAGCWWSCCRCRGARYVRCFFFLPRSHSRALASNLDPLLSHALSLYTHTHTHTHSDPRPPRPPERIRPVLPGTGGRPGRWWWEWRQGRQGGPRPSGCAARHRRPAVPKPVLTVSDTDPAAAWSCHGRG